MRQGNQTRDGPFWAEHFYEPCKAGMIDASGWAMYCTDPKTGEKVLVGWDVCLPYSLSEYAVERLAEIRKRLKRTRVKRMMLGGFFHEEARVWDIQTAKAIKHALKNYTDSQEV